MCAYGDEVDMKKPDINVSQFFSSAKNGRAVIQEIIFDEQSGNIGRKLMVAYDDTSKGNERRCFSSMLFVVEHLFHFWKTM